MIGRSSSTFIAIVLFFTVVFVGGNQMICTHAAPCCAAVGTSNENCMPRLEDMEVLVEHAKYWAHRIGLIIHTKNPAKKDAAKFHAFSLFPSPIPRKLFVKAVQLQKAYNELYFRVSQDRVFLIEMLKPVAQSNGRVRAWLDILEEIEADEKEKGEGDGIGRRQPITLLLARSDYMFHRVTHDKMGDKMGEEETEEEFELKQIEYNSGNYGGPGFAVRTTTLHRRIMGLAGRSVSEEFMPNNVSERHMALGIYEAWKHYGDPNAIVLMVSNKFSRWHEFGHIDLLIKKLSTNRIKIIYLSLFECAEKLSLDNDFTLRLDNSYTVGVVHFKNLFSTDPPPQVIATRRIVERSRAISTPTVAQDLASTKKIQQVLAMPGMLERFLPGPENADTVAQLRATFAGMWGLDRDDQKTEAFIQDAINNPDNYVMKASQEGGGHNFWGEEIAEKLRSFSPEERAAYILMEKVNPMIVKNILVHPYKQIEYKNVISELSIFGYLLANEMEVLQNLGTGHMMRTKSSMANEAGVGSSGGVIDSPYLL